MNKLLSAILIFIVCLLVFACSDDKEPEIYPIRFDQQDYSIFLGVGASISYVDGGGVYELAASDPEVLGKFGIDVETRHLMINPAKTGESTLTITDVRANSKVELHIKVEDFYCSFKVIEVEGDNQNPYIAREDEIRFVKTSDNFRQLLILREDHLSHQQKIVAEGDFDIERSETNIFTMQMGLHAKENEELEVFEYTIGGSGTILNLFNHFFDFDWEESVASKSSLPPQKIELVLVDADNNCKIACVMDATRTFTQPKQ